MEVGWKRHQVIGPIIRFGLHPNPQLPNSLPTISAHIVTLELQLSADIESVKEFDWSKLDPLLSQLDDLTDVDIAFSSIHSWEDSPDVSKSEKASFRRLSEQLPHATARDKLHFMMRGKSVSFLDGEDPEGDDIDNGGVSHVSICDTIPRLVVGVDNRSALRMGKRRHSCWQSLLCVIIAFEDNLKELPLAPLAPYPRVAAVITKLLSLLCKWSIFQERSLEVNHFYMS